MEDSVEDIRDTELSVYGGVVQAEAGEWVGRCSIATQHLLQPTIRWRVRRLSFNVRVQRSVHSVRSVNSRSGV